MLGLFMYALDLEEYRGCSWLSRTEFYRLLIIRTAGIYWLFIYYQAYTDTYSIDFFASASIPWKTLGAIMSRIGVSRLAGTA